MPQDVTASLRKRYSTLEAEAAHALAEVLCSAYKDATGEYPNDRLHEAIYEAVERNK